MSNKIAIYRIKNNLYPKGRNSLSKPEAEPAAPAPERPLGPRESGTQKKWHSCSEFPEAKEPHRTPYRDAPGVKGPSWGSHHVDRLDGHWEVTRAEDWMKELTEFESISAMFLKCEWMAITKWLQMDPDTHFFNSSAYVFIFMATFYLW